MARILIAANDVVAARMAGPGIRCVELGTQLATAGHDVTILGIDAPVDAFRGLSLVPPVSDSELAHLVQSYDVVLLEGLALVRYPSLGTAAIPLVVDLYDPFPLALIEQDAQGSEGDRDREAQRILSAFINLLRHGDFFICASERQRDLWMGSLLAVGRINPSTWDEDNTLRRLIDVVPFGISDVEAPIHTVSHREQIHAGLSEQDTVLLWAGGIYNWFDPLTLIRAVGRLVPDHPNLKLLFMSTTHPHPGVPGRMWMPRQARTLARDLGLDGTNVIFNDSWVPYAERGSWLAAADCGVSTHFAHLETRYAFRTRMLDYFWAGLPMICSDGDYFADLVRERQLGWVVAPEDGLALTNAIRQLVEGGAELERIRNRIRSVARSMTWTAVAEPLRRYCSQVSKAADWSPDRPDLQGVAQAPRTARAALQLGRKGIKRMKEDGPRSAFRQGLLWWRGRGPRT